MKNKKFVVLISFIFLIGGVFLVYNIYQNNKIDKTKRKKQNNLAIMIKEDGASDYIKSSSKDIPKGNYTLNYEKSYCKNNGVIGDYDSTLGKVSFSFIGTDSCYLYFDEKSITMNDIIINKIEWNSISITLDSSGDDENSKYYYSINNESYMESSKSSYIYENLSANTEYIIRAYFIDCYGNKSNVFEKKVATKEVITLHFEIEDTDYDDFFSDQLTKGITLKDYLEQINYQLVRNNIVYTLYATENYVYMKYDQDGTIKNQPIYYSLSSSVASGGTIMEALEDTIFSDDVWLYIFYASGTTIE